VFRLAFPEPVEGQTFDALTPIQQRVVRAVAETRTAWMPEENTHDAYFAATVASFGFPREPDEFRAFAGLPPFERRRRGVRRLLG